MSKLLQIQRWTENLQRNVIGEPAWIEQKSVFEYPEVTIEVVSILKLIRAVQSLKSLELLCQNGLFIDMGTIYRCVADCVSEIYFLLENYPNQSDKVKKFINNFSGTTIDNYLNPATDSVLANKIHNAMARSLTKSENDHKIQETIKRIYKTFSGYVHTNYSHVMEVYGGKKENPSFNLGGVPSDAQKHSHYQLVEQVEISVQHVVAYMASVFKQAELCAEINRSS